MNFVVSTEPYPPPENLFVGDTGREILTFSWDPINCHTLTYNIHPLNCGICSDLIITHPAMSVTCVNFTLDGRVCTFSVQTEVCGHIHGEMNKNISVTLLGKIQLLFSMITALSRGISKHILSYSSTIPKSEDCSSVFT